MNKEQLTKIENDINKLQADYKINKNLKFENINKDELLNRIQKLYDMNKFFDLHCEQMMYYNQHRIEELKNMYESDEIDRELFVKMLKQIHNSNEFIGEQCYVDRIEVLKRIYEVELELDSVENNDIID